MPIKADLFPWQYFDCPTDSAAEALVRWIYSEFSGRAYQGFVEQGRGLLVGPFLTGDGRDLIATEEFVERRKMNQEVGMTVVFVSMNSPVFEEHCRTRRFGGSLLWQWNGTIQRGNA